MIAALMIGLLILLFISGFSAPVALGATCIAYILLFLDASKVAVIPERVNAVFSDDVLVVVAVFVVYGRLATEAGARARLATTLAIVLGGTAIPAKVAEVIASLLQPDTAGDAILQRNDEAAATVNRLRAVGVPGWAAIGQSSALAFLRAVAPPGVLLALTGTALGTSIGDVYVVMLAFAGAIALAIIMIANMVPAEPASRIGLEQFSWHSIVWAFIPPLALTVVLLGYVTPSEAGAVAIAVALPIGLLLGDLNYRSLLRATLDSVQDIGSIYLVFLFASLLSFCIFSEDVPKSLGVALSVAGPLGAILVAIAATVIFSAVLGPLPTLLLWGSLMGSVLVEMGVPNERMPLIMASSVAFGLLLPPIGPVFATLAAGTTEPFGSVVRGVLAFSLTGLLLLCLALFGPLWRPF